MAKRTTRRATPALTRTSGFKVTIEPIAKAEQELTQLRSGRGGRESKYTPIAEALQDMPKGQIAKVELGKNEVGGLRGYLDRHYPDKFTIKSAKTDDPDTFLAFVYYTEEVES